MDLEKLKKECDMTTFRASGPGGQHRNVTDSAVRLKHRPTGIVVIGRRQRSQHQNLQDALERLALRIDQQRKEARRKKRVATRKSRAIREKELAQKKKRASLKALRGRVTES